VPGHFREGRGDCSADLRHRSIQFVADPHVEARQIVVDVPDAEIGSVSMHNVIPRLSATPGALRRPAPKLGEHNAEVLARVGISGDQLSALRDEEIV
jgi:crotonobetainyl-CoA:carnitine CoA-transferase CaiB-like acyl-CoA transferase